MDNLTEYSGKMLTALVGFTEDTAVFYLELPMLYKWVHYSILMTMAAHTLKNMAQCKSTNHVPVSLLTSVQ